VCRCFTLQLTVCGLAKVAIFTTNFFTKYAFQIYAKLSYEALNRHFCQTAVTGCPSVCPIVCRVGLALNCQERILGEVVSFVGGVAGGVFLFFRRVEEKKLKFLFGWHKSTLF